MMNAFEEKQTMNNCKDCKFWDRAWLNSKLNKAECLFAFGYITNGYYEKPEKDDAAFDLRINDDYGLTHRFMTGPMFGCVKFQSRR